MTPCRETIRETSSKAIKDRQERPAMMPDISLGENPAEIENVVAGKADLAYEMSFEVLPEVKLADFKSLKLERLLSEVEDEQLGKGAGRNRRAQPDVRFRRGPRHRRGRPRHHRFHGHDRRRRIRARFG